MICRIRFKLPLVGVLQNEDFTGTVGPQEGYQELPKKKNHTMMEYDEKRKFSKSLDIQMSWVIGQWRVGTCIRMPMGSTHMLSSLSPKVYVLPL